MDMTPFPKVSMTVSLWFLCLGPFGSFAELSMGRMPFPNVPMPVYPWFLFLVLYVSYPCFSVVPIHASLLFLYIVP